MQALFKMLSLSNAPTVAMADDDVAADVDEPPDDQISPLTFVPKDSQYPKAPRLPSYARRESLLTRAIHLDSHPEDAVSPLKHFGGRGLSTASSHSATSMASTAELTSDASPTRSCTPSPPIPNGFHAIDLAKHASSKAMVAPIATDSKPASAEGGEAAIEKTLGRKRCIMFACGGASTPESEKEKPREEIAQQQPPKRKCALTFICPSRQEPVKDNTITPPKPAQPTLADSQPETSKPPVTTQKAVEMQKDTSSPTPLSPQPFHEFGSSHDDVDPWINNATEHKGKLTLSDCMKKELAIRKLGEEAEEEAEQEERDKEEDMEGLDDQAHEDDFAPSDDGNESDDEGGFAESDDESDAGSDYQFWAPGALSTTTAATSTENLSHFSNRGRSRASSLESLNASDNLPARSADRPIFSKKASKASRLRPGTPELPDSTDFVCGTLDEDRPLEAAYKSCLELRKRQRHIPIPQDIDPSFPTSDPEDEEDEEDEQEESLGASGPMWMKDQFADFDVTARSKTPVALKSPTPPSPRNELRVPRPPLPRRVNTKSPPPPTRRPRSPPPPKHLLFGGMNDSLPRRPRSPAPMRLRSPPASPNNAPAFGHRIDLAQRPLAHRGRRERTASLPRTPNPFFKHFNVGSPSISNVASGAVTPAIEEPPRLDMHVRGPVDIVMGLERKRQKRKEKFWRQHCRKAAREHLERKQVPGRGAERMRELGLECAERNRGYGLAAHGAQVVISL